MPTTQLHFYEEDGSVPVYEWLVQLGRKDKKALANCLAKVRLLAEQGHELMSCLSRNWNFSSQALA
jgi:hypothetical protein